MELSYWENKTWLKNVDYTIIGSGIVGLNCALRLKQRHPKSKVLVLEKGILPQGASTKNAGFACFGSLSEILSDLESHSEEDVFNLVQNRIRGLRHLRELLGDKTIDFKAYGGYELFLDKDEVIYEECLKHQSYVNKLLRPLFSSDVFSWEANKFQFKGIHSQYAFNKFEGQIDTGKMMAALLFKAQKEGVLILNSCDVQSYSENGTNVDVETKNFSFTTQHLLIATNGFAAKHIGSKVKPARAQVFITNPINNLKIRGTFHLDKGYYYFRNIDNRILFGGGRNLDFEGEETVYFGLTEQIQNKLEELLYTVILPGTEVTIEQRWSGIMGVGNQKKPIVKPLGNRVFCGVRLGGMGVAIGSMVGNELADLIE